MNLMNRSFVALVLCISFAAAPALSQGEPVAKVVPNYTVFLDLPTGFVFVKLPGGWKFAGKVGAKDVAEVPPGVVTSLLTADDGDNETSQLASEQRKCAEHRAAHVWLCTVAVQRIA